MKHDCYKWAILIDGAEQAIHAINDEGLAKVTAYLNAHNYKFKVYTYYEYNKPFFLNK